MGGTVSPDRVLRELAELWVTLGGQEEGDNGAGVLRACSMTLVVVTAEADDPMDLGETLAALMPEHPARAIVVRVRADGERGLAARVFSQCWKPFGQRRQICCEQVEITASDTGLEDLRALVLPLCVPDLPVMLWCRDGRLPSHPQFPDLTAMASRVRSRGVTTYCCVFFGVTSSPSLKESTTTSPRRFANASRKVGLVSMVSARAWMNLVPYFI